MYLSNRDLLHAIKCKTLIVEPTPRPEDVGATSIDLHLDGPDEAKIWNLGEFNQDLSTQGNRTGELRIGKFDYRKFGGKYLVPPPLEGASKDAKVFRRGADIIVKNGGFLLWQTKERVGTPEEGAGLVCFIDGKSTRARTGLLVHLTAPTIHASWSGKVTLEIANLGPFDFVLCEDDVIAQITVANITSIPDKSMKESGSVTIGQAHVGGDSDR